MALIQSDYDGLVPQIVNKKRTSGGNSGKTVREWETGRGAVGLAALNQGHVRLTYTDGVSELFTYNPDVELYPPGR